MTGPGPRRRRRSSSAISSSAVSSHPYCSQPHASKLPLRQLFHGVAHTLAAESRSADAAERIGVEPETARVVDPERADPQLARHFESGLETFGEAGAL